MQKQKKIGLVLLIVMLLGSITMLYLIKNNETNNETNNGTNKEKLIEEVDFVSVNLYTLDSKNISRIEIKDDGALILEKKESRWIDADYNGLVYNDVAIENIIKEVASLESIQVIHNVQDEQKYGINDRSRIITLYDTANNNYSFRLGSFSENQGGIYIGTDLEETLYFVKSQEPLALFQTREDLLTRNLIMPNQDQVQHIKISKKLEPVIYIQKNDKAGYKDYERWVLKGFFKEEHELHTETVDTIIHQIIAFEKDGFVGKAENLDQYGLEDPELVITINDQTIKFGAQQNDAVYFMYDQEPYVYKMSVERLKIVDELKPIAMIRKQVYVPDYSKLSQITLSKQDHTLDLMISKQITAKGFSLAGIIEEKGFNDLQTRELIQLITDSIMIEAVLKNPEIEEKSSRKAEVIIHYTYEDKGTQTIELVPYDSNFYILRLEEDIEFAVDKEKVMHMFSILSEMIKESDL